MSYHLARARRNGEWVEGYYLKTRLLDTETGYDIPPHYSPQQVDFIIDREGFHHSVDPDTLQRCTGLGDKNGNWIFEGQYFECDGNLYRIFWWSKSASFEKSYLNERGRWFPVKIEDIQAAYLDADYLKNIEVFDEVKFNDDGSWERLS